MTKTPSKSPYRGRFKTPLRFEAERASALAALDEFSPEVREQLVAAPSSGPCGPRLQPVQPPPAPKPLRIALKVPRNVRPAMWLGLALVIGVSVAWSAARMVTGSAPATIILPSSRVAMSPLDGRAPIVTARPPVVRVAARRTPPAVRTPPARVQPAPVPAAPAGYYGSLAIEASPAGARVFINGRLAGTAPIEVRDLAAGSRVVRIEADGYQPWSAAVRIVADQQARISVNLHQAR